MSPDSPPAHPVTVRPVTSLLVAIGQGKWPETTIAERFESLSRDHLPSPAPASGLALVAVGYEETSETTR